MSILGLWRPWLPTGFPDSGVDTIIAPVQTIDDCAVRAKIFSLTRQCLAGRKVHAVLAGLTADFSAPCQRNAASRLASAACMLSS